MTPEQKQDYIAFALLGCGTDEQLLRRILAAVNGNCRALLTMSGGKSLRFPRMEIAG